MKKLDDKTVDTITSAHEQNCTMIAPADSLYRLAKEVVRWRRVASGVINQLDSADDDNVWRALGFALGALEVGMYDELEFADDGAGATENSRGNENVQVMQEQSGIIHATEPTQSGSEVEAAPVIGVTTGKPLTITLPDTSSKAFWSGTGKSEVFHPEAYRRWAKEAIERSCAISGIEVRVK